MLRQLRQQLHLIRYYSAARPETAWTRALEWALLAALLLGLPAALVCEGLAARPVPALEVSGTIARARDRALLAEVQRLDARVWSGDSNPHGEFTLEVVDRHSGWPFTTLTQRRPPRLDLNIYTQPGVRRNAQLAENAPLRAAIEAALADAGHRELLDAWRNQDSPIPRRIWLTTIVGAVLWWVLLSFLAFVTIELLRLAVRFLRARHHRRIARRLARGHCGYCGYNLRGLEFSERCPECGKLVH